MRKVVKHDENQIRINAGGGNGFLRRGAVTKRWTATERAGRLNGTWVGGGGGGGGGAARLLPFQR